MNACGLQACLNGNQLKADTTAQMSIPVMGHHRKTEWKKLTATSTPPKIWIAICTINCCICPSNDLAFHFDCAILCQVPIVNCSNKFEQVVTIWFLSKSFD